MPRWVFLFGLLSIVKSSPGSHGTHAHSAAITSLPEAACAALLAHTGDDIQVKVLGGGEFTIPGELPSGDRPDEAWCAVYKWTTGPGEMIETEGDALC